MILGGLKGLGPTAGVREAVQRFGERAFRVALHHMHPETMSPLRWKYWHLRLHGEPPRRPAPTVITEMRAAFARPPDFPEPEATQWPPRHPGGRVDYRTCLRHFG